MMAACDYCGADLGCEENSPEDRWYWSTGWGLRSCHACLAQRYSDFPKLEGDARILALRLLHANHPPTGEKVQAEIAPGRVVSVPEPVGININTVQTAIDEARSIARVQYAERDLAHALQLHKQGQYLAAMEAGRTLWERAGVLNSITSTSRQQRAKASKPRDSRSLDIKDQIIQIGQSLALSRPPHEVVGIVAQRVGQEATPKTIRKYLRDAGVIPQAKKKGT